MKSQHQPQYSLRAKDTEIIIYTSKSVGWPKETLKKKQVNERHRRRKISMCLQG